MKHGLKRSCSAPTINQLFVNASSTSSTSSSSSSCSSEPVHMHMKLRPASYLSASSRWRRWEDFASIKSDERRCSQIEAFYWLKTVLWSGMIFYGSGSDFFEGSFDSGSKSCMHFFYHQWISHRLERVARQTRTVFLKLPRYIKFFRIKSFKFWIRPAQHWLKHS